MKLKKIGAILGAFVLAISLMGSSTIDAANSNIDRNGDDWLHCEGNKIYDMQGNEVWLTGTNWFGFNVGSQVFDGVWSQNMHDMINQMADRGINFLRIPVSTQILLQWKNDEPDPSTPKVNPYTNPELVIDDDPSKMTVMDSKSLFNKAVEWCDDAGMKIMIDIHSAETHAAGHQFALWYNEKYSTQDLYDALTWFADEYKNDDTILAIDIKNEPHGKADTPNDMAIWDDSDLPNNWKNVAQTAALKILDVNPNLLIIVEGVEVYPKDGYDWTAPSIDWATNFTYYHNTWWGANLRGVRENPIELGDKQSQLVYSPHDYGPLVWKQSWFYEGFNTETLMADCWYDNWAFIHEENIAPILVGEWGGFMDGGDNEKWMTCIRDYMIEERIHHTFWCFNENSGDTGGLMYDNFSKWDEEKYALLKPALWQNDEGKFVGLDHQVPLGENGISLNEHFGDEVIPAVGKKGDANNDNKVDTCDLALIKQYIVKGDGVQINLDNSDMDENGSVELSDIAKLNRFILGM